MISRSLQSLRQIAMREVALCRKQFSTILRTKAEGVLVLYMAKPNKAMRLDGIEHDTLGLFVGKTFTEEYLSGIDAFPSIILFVRNIWDDSEKDTASFREGVRLTYLHELGHYLGLDEKGLEERCLD